MTIQATIGVDNSVNNRHRPDQDLIYKSILFLYKYPQIIGYEYKVLKDTYVDITIKVDLLKEKEMIRKYYKVASLNLSSGTR